MTAETAAPAAEKPKKRPNPGPAERARLRAIREGRDPEAERAPRRTPGPAPRVATGRRTRLEVETGAMLVQINLGITMGCAMAAQMGLPLDPTSDPLQPNEIVLLAKGVAMQAEAHATFRKYLNAALAVSGSAGLVTVLVAILAVRLSNHGVIPENAGLYANLALMADPSEVDALVKNLVAEEEAA